MDINGRAEVMLAYLRACDSAEGRTVPWRGSWPQRRSYASETVRLTRSTRFAKSKDHEPGGGAGSLAAGKGRNDAITLDHELL